MWFRRALFVVFSSFQRGADLEAVIGRCGGRRAQCDDCAVVEADAFAKGCRGGPCGGGQV